MKKAILLLIGFVVIGTLVACNNNMTTDNNTTNNTKNEVVKKKDKKLDKTIKLDDKLMFNKFNIQMKKVHVYEKSKDIYATITFNWLNHFGKKAKFMMASSLDVEQNDKVLDDTKNAWADTKSDVYFPNANKGSAEVQLTYRLENKEDPLKITFAPHSDEDSETINVDIK